MREVDREWKLCALSRSETERSETVLNRFRRSVKPSTWTDKTKGGESLRLQCSQRSLNREIQRKPGHVRSGQQQVSF